MNLIKEKLEENKLFSNALVNSIYETITKEFKEAKEIQIILQKQSAMENAFMLMIKDTETHKRFVAIGDDLEQYKKEDVNVKICL